MFVAQKLLLWYLLVTRAFIQIFLLEKRWRKHRHSTYLFIGTAKIHLLLFFKLVLASKSIFIYWFTTILLVILVKDHNESVTARPIKANDQQMKLSLASNELPASHHKRHHLMFWQNRNHLPLLSTMYVITKRIRDKTLCSCSHL